MKAPRRWHQSKLPALFGGYGRTDLLVTLAVLQRVRRTRLLKNFGYDLIQPRGRVHPAGVTVQWKIGKNRGSVLALNPLYPLIGELRRFLLALAKHVEIETTCDVLATEWRIPGSATKKIAIQLESLFGSRTRTLTLVTLELLGGRARRKELHHCVPGEFYEAVRNETKRLLSESVLEREDDKIRFVSATWAKELRQLLRAYARIDKTLAPEVKGQRRFDGRASKRVAEKYSLLGPPRIERMLVALAERGPLSSSRLFASAKTKYPKGLGLYEQMGVLVRFKRGRFVTYSLNKAHPLHKEIRRLLLSLGAGSRGNRSNDLIVRQTDFEADRLFTRPLRTALLLSLQAAGTAGLDASALSRLLPEHDRGKISKALKRFEKNEIIGHRKWKTMNLFVLNPSNTHYKALHGLLAKANKIWPEYAANAVSILEKLHPPGRLTLQRD